MVKVKICGITRIEDAMAAVELGADALGFNFFKKSARYIEPSKAKPIIDMLPPLTSAVGVFVDEYSPERVKSISQAMGLAAVQLHGNESPQYLKKISDLRVIKAFRVQDNFDPEALQAFPASAYLLDGYDPQKQGGTGRTFPWEIALRAKQFGRIIVAGGLTAQNIRDVIVQVQPYAVDICSGVESEPGLKDLQKLEGLLLEVRRARAELTTAGLRKEAP
ncbi:MAG: phosphoribosylanthranilate isomerase [Acidobacteriota bacterium]